MQRQQQKVAEALPAPAAACRAAAAARCGPSARTRGKRGRDSGEEHQREAESCRIVSESQLGCGSRAAAPAAGRKTRGGMLGARQPKPCELRHHTSHGAVQRRADRERPSPAAAHAPRGRWAGRETGHAQAPVGGSSPASRPSSRGGPVHARLRSRSAPRDGRTDGWSAGRLTQLHARHSEERHALLQQEHKTCPPPHSTWPQLAESCALPQADAQLVSAAQAATPAAPQHNATPKASAQYAAGRGKKKEGASASGAAQRSRR